MTAAPARLLSCGALLLLAGAGAVPRAGSAASGEIQVTPTSLSMPPALVNELVRDTVIVRNLGSSALTLGRIVVSHPSFTAGSQSGGIPPGTTIDPSRFLRVEVSFRSAVLGTTSATMTIPSDDADEPEVVVALQGVVVPPAVIQVSPDSLSEDLGPAEVRTRQLLLSNTGGSDLRWTLGVVPGTGKRSLAPPNLQGVSVLWDRTHGQIGTTAWQAMTDSMEALGATVTERTGQPGELTPTVLGAHRLFWTIEATQQWTAAERTALADWMANGGGMLVVGDNTSSIAPFDSLLAGVGSQIRFSQVPASPPQATTTAIHPHPVTQGLTTLYVGSLAKTLALSLPALPLFDDASAQTMAAAEEVGLGRVVAVADEAFDDPTIQTAGSLGAQNLTFGIQVIDWLAGVNWLTTPTPGGTVAPGSTQTVDLVFDTTGLTAGGSFDVRVRIFSNDPATPLVDVPVHLVLTGVPDIVTVPASLDFGPVIVDSAFTKSLRVHNLGQDTLDVSQVTASGRFSAPAAPFQVVPAGSALVPVTFQPDSIGPFSGTVSLASNDPDTPTASVSVQGLGRQDCNAACPPPSVGPADLQGSPGFLFPVDVFVDQTADSIRAFGFTATYDGTLLTFDGSQSVGTLDPDFAVSATENRPGVVTCGGFGQTAIPAGSSGSIARLFFRVACDTCPFGTTSDVSVGAFTNDLVGMNACCGTFTLTRCPQGSGDVNTDGRITPQDALCALKIFTSGGAPADSQCDGTGTCEVEIADANCDGTVDPGDALLIYDAWVAGLIPVPCIGGSPSPPGGGTEVRWGLPVTQEDGSVTFPVVAAGEGVRALGLDVEVGPGWEWLGFENGAAGGWALLEGGAPAPGLRRIGAVDPEGRGRSGEVFRLRLRPVGEGRGPVVLAAGHGVSVAGPRGALPGGAPGAAEGIERVGPVPSRHTVDVAFSVAEEGARGALRVLDVTGREVRRLAQGPWDPGRHAVSWDGRDGHGRSAAAGIYFVELLVEGKRWTRKVVLLR